MMVPLPFCIFQLYQVCEVSWLAISPLEITYLRSCKVCLVCLHCEVSFSVVECYNPGQVLTPPLFFPSPIALGLIPSLEQLSHVARMTPPPTTAIQPLLPASVISQNGLTQMMAAPNLTPHQSQLGKLFFLSHKTCC